MAPRAHKIDPETWNGHEVMHLFASGAAKGEGRKHLTIRVTINTDGYTIAMYLVRVRDTLLYEGTDFVTASSVYNNEEAAPLLP